MNTWAQRHRDALEAALDDGEELVAAERVIAPGRRRRRPRDFPRGGFVFVVTNRRYIALEASRWLARPGPVIASWPFEAGYALGAGSPWTSGRVHLVLPDRSVVTLAPYGGRSLGHLLAR
ncbi:MAG TPA: hypothetical protein VMZ22_00455 [Acidimicrobiales bacterium]|nr:hypothetical protein [Acidimicrobiales bacterium]